MHHVVVPFSAINSAIGPDVDTISFNGIVVPLTKVSIAVRPDILSSSLFLGVFVLAFILASVYPVF